MIHYLARCHIHRAISHIHLRVIHTCHRVIFGSRRSSCYRSRSGRCLSFGRRSGITTTCKYERREDDELQPMNMTKRYKSSSKRNEISMNNSRTILDEMRLPSIVFVHTGTSKSSLYAFQRFANFEKTRTHQFYICELGSRRQ